MATLARKAINMELTSNVFVRKKSQSSDLNLENERNGFATGLRQRLPENTKLPTREFMESRQERLRFLR